MTARAMLNLVDAIYCLHLARNEGTIGAKVGALVMVGAAIGNARMAIALKA